MGVALRKSRSENFFRIAAIEPTVRSHHERVLAFVHTAVILILVLNRVPLEDARTSTLVTYFVLWTE